MAGTRDLYNRIERGPQQPLSSHPTSETYLLGNLLEGATDQPGPGDTARCWQALDYTKPRTVTMTPTLRGPQGQLASSIDGKETLFVRQPSPRRQEIARKLRSPKGPGMARWMRN